MTKIGVCHFYPSAKSRREQKIKTLGVIFRDASAYYIQKAIAPQNRQFVNYSDENLSNEKFYQKILTVFFFPASKNEMLEII